MRSVAVGLWKTYIHFCRKKRKRKHKADLELKLRQLAAGEDFKPEVSPTSPNESVDTRTKAQKAFAKVKEERVRGASDDIRF